ncbi:hypothetical protein GCM10027043_39440 [Ferruginibacter profundus]
MASCTGHSGKADKQAVVIKKDVATQKIAPKIISDSTNELTGKIQQLELEYVVWGCACANWISPGDRIKYQKENALSSHSIFIEPADSTLRLPDFFDASKHNLIVTGQFYKNEDYPKGTLQTEENLEKAKVFRYTEFRMHAKGEKLKPHIRNQTFTVSYGLTGCTCAQWLKTISNAKPFKKELFYLERANEKLVDADTLFKGSSLPKISVTGYFISDKAYPKNYNPSKGSPDPAKVFRYEKIKIISR